MERNLDAKLKGCATRQGTVADHDSCGFQFLATVLHACAATADALACGWLFSGI